MLFQLKKKKHVLRQFFFGPGQWFRAYLAKITLAHYLSMPIIGVSCLNFNKFHYHTFIEHHNCVNAKYEIIPKGGADFYHICI